MATNAATSPFTLEGAYVRLEPLCTEHAPILWEIARNDCRELFEWVPYRLESLEDFQEFNAYVLREQAQGVSIPFATFIRNGGQIAGSTRFMNMDLRNRKVEIGSTWVAPPWQRTFVNTEAKYLMLRHAFECWNCLRVEFKTDALNERSRRAILRLGAKEEGTLRKHLLTWNGRSRDSIYFSILDSEWPEVKRHLEMELARHGTDRVNSGAS
ncbi:MAG: GNAT family N-acetyltransferase [Acidobacteria bacterium]|nr:GNAT family N-acetyltransferase [Acidobacteriota bacterium]MBV9623943.1 GNAT family N-acetyltransferase [Acidobacteriota bacterium]